MSENPKNNEQKLPCSRDIVEWSFTPAFNRNAATASFMLNVATIWGGSIWGIKGALIAVAANAVNHAVRFAAPPVCWGSERQEFITKHWPFISQTPQFKAVTMQIENSALPVEANNKLPMLNTMLWPQPMRRELVLRAIRAGASTSTLGWTYAGLKVAVGILSPRT